MAELSGRTVLVTGATDGLGRALALDLARRGATVLVHGRSLERVGRTVAEIRDVATAPPRGYLADFSSLADVRALAEDILDQEERLDVLVNNAGIGATVPGGPARQVSQDGWELRFAVNYLAPYLLTRLLLPLVRKAPARIVNVSSAGQAPLDPDNVMLHTGYSGRRAYCQSKLAQIMFTIDLGAHLAGHDVTVNALHPATYMPTKIVEAPLSPLSAGVTATARLAAAPDLGTVTGQYFDGVRRSQAHPQAYDGEVRTWLWRLSADLAGLPHDEL
jgi:NAD(P)-dependent dehydrogenase (short-subunit alcohol dehydrogenase family)